MISMAGFPERTDPRLEQQKVLMERVLAPNRDCEYGRRCSFSSIESVDDYRRAVPIVTYDDLEPYIRRMAEGEPGLLVSKPVRRFFLTSGTASRPKYIPVTQSFIAEKLSAFDFFWRSIHRDHPQVKQGSMVNYLSGGQRDRANKCGNRLGSENAFWSNCASRLKRGSPLLRAVCNLPDPESRYYVLARILLETDVSLFMALNPSTLLRLFGTIDRFSDRLLGDVARGGLATEVEADQGLRDEISAKFKGNPKRAQQLRGPLGRTPFLASALWSGLELAVHWMSPMLQPYLNLLAPYLDGVQRREYISMASEGILAIPLQDGRPGGALATPIHFYEFIPLESCDQEQPETLLADQLETGRKYVVVLSNSAGLYRYNIGDVLRVRGWAGKIPVVEFLHRVGSTCSLTGEKLTEEQVSASVAAAAQGRRLSIESFTACPVEQPFPHYQILVEFSTGYAAGRHKAFVEQVERELCERNIEYRSKRRSGRLASLELVRLPAGSYSAYRRKRVAEGASEDQLKPIHLTRDPQFYRKLVPDGLVAH